MQIPFRQGIVKSVPNFIQITGSTVSLVIPQPDYVLVTIADGDTDYLVAEKSSVANAWSGPFSSGTDYWLYWDLNPSTGAKTYGYTLLEPVEGATAPAAPIGDQHWFDTTTNTTKVWVAAAGRWVKKIRVFAARLTSSSSLVSMSIGSPAFTGTQVGGYVNTPVLAGFLVYDSEGKALRKGNGEFFTTEDKAITGITTSSRVRFSSIVQEAESIANMSNNTIVVFTDFDKIGPANPIDVIQTKQLGIIEEDVIIGGFVNVVMDGTVSSTDWDWSLYGVNTPLYLAPGGVLLATPTPPALVPVAVVTGKNSIHMGTPSIVINSTGGSIGVMSNTAQGTGRLSLASATPLDPVVVGDNDPRLTDARPPLTHTHAIADVTNLQFFLDGKVNLLGGTMIGALILNADPVDALGAATKQYVDDAPFVELAGDTMTGYLILNADPVDDLGAATKQYVDTHSGGGGGAAAPITEILFGTGPSVESVPEFTYDKTTGAFLLDARAVASPGGVLLLGANTLTDGSSNQGGPAALVGGNALNAGDGGYVNLQGGAAASGSAGGVYLTGGDAATTGSGGSVEVTAGNSGSGSGGYIQIRTGYSNDGSNSGSITLNTLDAALVGTISLTTGSGAYVANGSGGNITLTTGNGNTNSGTPGAGGNLSATAGNGYTGGNISLSAGRTEDAGSSLGGNITLAAGSKNDYGGGAGGYVLLKGGIYGYDSSHVALTYVMGGETGASTGGMVVTRASEQVLTNSTANLTEPPVFSTIGNIPCSRHVVLNLTGFGTDPIDMICPVAMKYNNLWNVKAYISIASTTDRATFEVSTTMEYSGVTASPQVMATSTTALYRSLGATSDNWAVVAGTNGASVKYTISSTSGTAFSLGGNASASLYINQVFIPA